MERKGRDYEVYARLFGAEQARVDRLVERIEETDSYLATHSRNVASYARTLAVHAYYPQQDIYSVYQIGRMHDIGKTHEDYTPLRPLPFVGEPPANLREIAQGHVRNGELMSAFAGINPGWRAGIRSHHENWDGTGYPDGKAEIAIPRVARILRVADSFSAATERNGWHPEAVRDDLLKYFGSWYDPALKQPFLAFFDDWMESYSKR